MDPTARSAILKVRSACMDLREMPLHSFTAGYLYRLDEFSDLQEQQRIQVRAAAHAMQSDRESLPNIVC
jgi:hypothetical protein